MEKQAMPEPDLQRLFGEVDRLVETIAVEAADRIQRWEPAIERSAFHADGANLAHYLALRRRDLRALQRDLMALGLSSLGRLESRVMPTLLAVRSALAAIAGLADPGRPPVEAFFSGEQALENASRTVFGPENPRRPVSLLVTCPSEAADDASFMLRLAQLGVESVRINCAHDDADRWTKMIDHARAAGGQTGRPMRVFMDLAGPKIRTGLIRGPIGVERALPGARLAIVPPGGLDAVPEEAGCFAAECTLGEAVAAAHIGDRLFVDDGKLAARIDSIEPWGLMATVVAAADKGVRLKSEKGLNFPDTLLDVPALTAKDRADLAFIAAHADGVGYSFVQSAADVALLQEALAAQRPDDWRTLALILKIETPRGVAALPDIIAQAAGRQPTAVMIARGDLAVEIGFARLAEMQEEIMWIGEAARVPVIWATQVLEHLIRKGTPSRGEMTDAAMAARAECVMLNKGPFLFEAIAELDTLLERMTGNQRKKTPQLRRLRSW
jgi:pyruvate kinase